MSHISDTLPAPADERAEIIFPEALTLPPEKRAAFLTEACGADARLRAEVESLLDDYHKAGTFLIAEASAARELGAEFGHSASEQPGDWIGPYKLMEQIGEGGFGTVWVAEQEKPVRRRVALKIIKPGMDSRQVIARFEQERQALAMMDHPNIAKVFDAGATPLGRPYFVMEMVRGIRITKYCDQAGLSTAERLRLFIQVCQAVQHAHQKGIIHRDLKPSNILVTLHDGVPVPKVIDFGVAKATQQQRLTDITIYTQFEQIVGTPLYMSPEQAEMSGLDIDTRGDIYSLGVLLYELLTGTTPFDSKALLTAGFDEMRRVIRETEPPKPSTRLTQISTAYRTAGPPDKSVNCHSHSPIDPDLDWIVMKALEKDRTRRYETATGFAQDIQRHLASEPVLARPPSAGYRFRRMVRRNKVAFAAGAAVLTALLAGLGVSTWMFFNEKEARQRAVAAEEAQKRERRLAETESEKSREVSRFLQEMLAGVDPSIAQGSDTKLLRQILDKTAARLQNDLKSQPEVEAELRLIIGKVYGGLGDYGQAVAMLEEALAITKRLHGNEHKGVVSVLNQLAMMLGNQGRLDEAETMFGEAMAIQRRLGREDVSTTLNNLSLTLMDRGRHAEAETVLREALTLHRKFDGNDHADTATTLGNLAGLLEEQGKLDEAEPLLREALGRQQNLMGSEHPDVAATLNTLANVVQKQNKIPESEALFREVLALQRKLLGNAHPNVASALNGLGLALHKQGKDAEAEPLLREGMEIQKNARQTAHPQTARLTGNLGRVLQGLQRYAEAEACYREALAIYSKLPGDEHPDVASWRNRIFNLLQDQKKWAELEVLQRETLTILKSRSAGEHPEVAAALTDLAMILENQEKLTEAETIYREALAMRRKLPGSDPDVVRILDRTALLLNRQGRNPEAEPFMREAVSTNRSLLAKEDPVLARQIGNLGIILEAQRKYAESEIQFREALAMSKKLRGTSNPKGIIPWHIKLLIVLEKQGKVAEQETLLRGALEEARGLEPANPLRVETQILTLGENLYRQNKFAEAERLCREVIESRQARPGTEQKDMIVPRARLARLLAEWAWTERVPDSEIKNQKPEVIAHALEAERLMRQCLEASLRMQSAGTRESAEYRSRLGGALLAVAVTNPALTESERIAKFTEAESLLLEGSETLQQDAKADRTSKREAITRLVRLYEAWNKPDKTAEWRKKLAAFDKTEEEQAANPVPRDQ
jgi:serine/threonine protein kinase/tetratricopeptide (TPR) repeat protein